MDPVGPAKRMCDTLRQSVRQIDATVPNSTSLITVFKTMSSVSAKCQNESHTFSSYINNLLIDLIRYYSLRIEYTLTANGDISFNNISPILLCGVL